MRIIKDQAVRAPNQNNWTRRYTNQTSSPGFTNQRNCNHDEGDRSGDTNAAEARDGEIMPTEYGVTTEQPTK